MKRTASPPITAEIASYIKRMLEAGLYQHQIAGVLGINQGRVSEVKTGKRNVQVAIGERKQPPEYAAQQIADLLKKE